MIRSSSIGLFSSALLTLVLCSCGGGGSGGDAGGGGGDGGGGSVADTTAPTAVLSQTAALTANEHIVIRFSEAMNPASLHLNGTLTTDSIGSVWSKTNVENDTLTLSSKIDGWTSGSGRTLMVDGKDLAGNALATLNATYAVKLALDNFQNAAVVIGQPGFAAGATNQGGGAGANTLAAPHGNVAVSAEGRLFIGDHSNNRVLAYNRLPTANNANADFVLGQTDFFTTTSATNQSTHMNAQQVATEDGKLVVADYGSNRVVIYNTVPANGAAVAGVVVGQPDFISTGSACTAASLLNPEVVATTPGGKLIVTDSGHNRVLIWNAMPATWGQPADVVVGQSDFVHCTQNDDDQNGSVDATPSARTFNYPTGVWTDGTRLVVADGANNRVLIWNQMPTTNFKAADVVLGQSNFMRNAPNDDNQDGAADTVPTSRTLNNAFNGISSNGLQLAIADTANHRVLIWNSFPTSNFQAADVVLGQSDFGHNKINDDDQNGTSDLAPSARTFGFPDGVLFYRDKLLVTDNLNNRLLIFKSK
jgi:hypothetical protein